jgi:hypothetical protein
MPTRYRRIQVTEDAELARALRESATRLPRGLSRAGQVRELAIAGARALGGESIVSEQRRGELVDRLASHFEQPESAPWDWDLLDVKHRAWRSFK